MSSFAINLYLRWLYADDMAIEEIAAGRSGDCPDLVSAIASLWSFAEWISDFACCNAICDSIAQVVLQDGRLGFVNNSTLEQSWSRTRTGSVLRVLLIDLRLYLSAKNAAGLDLASQLDVLPPMVTRELAKRYLSNERYSDALDKLVTGDNGASCRYHLHPDGQRCKGSRV
jgi:hypothetical protein